MREGTNIKKLFRCFARREDEQNWAELESILGKKLGFQNLILGLS